jgi:hypothetical protein
MFEAVAEVHFGDRAKIPSREKFTYKAERLPIDGNLV